MRSFYIAWQDKETAFVNFKAEIEEMGGKPQWMKQFTSRVNWRRSSTIFVKTQVYSVFQFFDYDSQFHVISTDHKVNPISRNLPRKLLIWAVCERPHVKDDPSPNTREWNSSLHINVTIDRVSWHSPAASG